jgi:hypothetical protein
MNPHTLLAKTKRIWHHFWQNRMKRASVLEDLIRGVEESSGLDRTHARAEAKAWLISHVASMNRYDIEVARSHFGYLLPANWGMAS